MSEPTRQGTPVLWALIASIIALVLIVGGFLGYNLMAEEDLGASEKTTEVTSSSASEKTTTEQATTTEKTTTQPEPVYAEPVQPTYAEPTYAEPVQPTYTQQYTSYDHNSHTSPAFAANVYGAWQQNYAATGQANTQLNVYSPTTGSNYNMTCYESGSAIRCVGGNNAVISIF